MFMHIRLICAPIKFTYLLTYLLQLIVLLQCKYVSKLKYNYIIVHSWGNFIWRTCHY